MSLRRRLSLLSVLIAAAAALALPQALPAQGADDPPVASSFEIVKYVVGQVDGDPRSCRSPGYFDQVHFTRHDCGYGYADVSGTTADSTVMAVLVGSDGKVIEEQTTTYRAADDAWSYTLTPAEDWPAGPVRVRFKVGDQFATGEQVVYVNQLAVTAEAVGKTGGYRPGQPVQVTGTVKEQDSDTFQPQTRPASGATLKLRVIAPDGADRGAYGPFTTGDDGTFAGTLPAAATQGLAPTRATGYRLTLRLEADDTAHDTATGPWTGDGVAAGSFAISQPPTELVLENSFVSSVGWVKPGEEYPFTLRVLNYTSEPKTGATVRVPAPDGTQLDPGDGAGATMQGTTLVWDAGTVPAATGRGPGVKQLVAGGRADTLELDPQIVWKNLSTRATLAYDGGPAGLAATSHGPKVIPRRGGYETARYGDRPFPVVPVDYTERKHGPGHSGDRIATKINDPEFPGSTFNLFQEISYGQLFPNGTVPSNGIASAGWSYGPGFDFTKNDPTTTDTCRGVSEATLGTGYTGHERIRDGWYQLPGPTDYYGDDSKGSALIGSVAGVGALADIDSGCGPTGKAVYDAAQIADPEIDYSDYDTDKDGVVDFFMMIYAGAGGNGESQVQGYDNIWPHSYTLEAEFEDPETGLDGYISDDQLRDLEERPLWYTDETRTEMTTQNKGEALKVYTRVGPYNVNPENSIDQASVISHEYGHSLGLPDYYSNGGRETYGTWNLMATDHSQNMDAIGKKELGWLIPRVLKPGETKVTDWQDTKRNTHRIDWVQPDGTPYALEGPSVDNGEGYVATLPGRRVLPAAEVPSGSHVWWSGSDDDFGCAPESGRNLDIALPQLESVPAGTPITVTFASRWDIERDYDYGFVMTTTDGESYASRPSSRGYTTEQETNPNDNPCQAKFGNGITGSSGSYAEGSEDLDRETGIYPDPVFLFDEYELSDLAGKQGATLRFSFSSDDGGNRTNWFIDDLQVKAAGKVIYRTDFEQAREPAVYNGGCRDDLQTAKTCTDGWSYHESKDGSPAEHAYIMEMRDRSGFDANGRGEANRGPITFSPGMLLTYTDEFHGYGNSRTADPPAQSPLDSQPEPGVNTPNLDDAAWTAADGDRQFSDSGAGHTDNYADPSSEDGDWHFAYDCLTFNVARMVGDDTIGPEATGQYDLAGDVSFRLNKGCAPFNYGTDVEDIGVPPTARGTAKPNPALVGQAVVFDAGGSFDDDQAPEALTYSWDFDGDGAEDAAGSSARRTFARAGRYEAKLTVTDADGLSSTATVPVTVDERPPGGGDGPGPGGDGPGGTVGPGPEGGPGGPGGPGGTGGPDDGGDGGERACASDAGFSEVKVSARGGRLRFSADRRVRAPYTVDLFQVARGRTVVGERLVARFSGRTTAFRWNGRRARRGRAVSDGVYFARYTMRSGGVRDVRRVALRRSSGRFSVIKSFYRRESCDLLRAFKLSSPAFGGRGGRSLGIAYRLRSGARVEVRVLRGSKVVRRFGAGDRTAGRTHRLRLGASGLRRGDYRVELRASGAGKTVRSTLVSRRL